MSGTSTSSEPVTPDACNFNFSMVGEDTLHLRLSGRWCIGCELPSASTVDERLDEAPAVKCITFDVDGLSEWDSGLLAYLLNLIKVCGRRDVQMDRASLPPGVRRLLALATAVPEQKGTRGSAAHRSVLVRIGDRATGVAIEGKNILGFIEDLFLRKLSV